MCLTKVEVAAVGSAGESEPEHRLRLGAKSLKNFHSIDTGTHGWHRP